MAAANSILIVDDEDTFRQSTAELFRRDGYACDCAADADEAVEMLKANQYGVLISDIKMPGNADLKLVRQVQQLAPAMPVILVTGYPSADSAIKAVELPVVAYLKKPVDHAELRSHVLTSIERSQSRRTISYVRQLLQKCVHDVEDIERECPLPGSRSLDTVEIPTVTVRTLTTCLTELLQLQASAASHKATTLCELVDCPAWPAQRGVLQHAVSVLRETRRRFKSKELADLRARLESALEGSAEITDDACS